MSKLMQTKNNNMFFLVFYFSLCSWSTHVQAGCQISAQNLDFGNYDPSLAFATHSSAELYLLCTENRNVTIEIGPSSVTGSINERKMRHVVYPQETLAYTISSDFLGLRVWGDTTQGMSVNQPVSYYTTIRLYGKILAAQQPWVGSYSDKITVTIQP